MYRWFIALKYLTARFITFAALLIVASAVALLIVILSVMEGFRSDLMDRIRGTSSDIRVEARGIGLRDPARAAEEVLAVPGVRAVAPYVESGVIYQMEGDTESVQFGLEGLDLSREGAVGDLPEYIAAARRRAARGETDDLAPVLGRDRDLESLARQPDASQILSPAWLEKGLWEASGLPRPPPDARPVLVGYELTRSPFGLTPGHRMRLTSISPVTNRERTAEFYVAGVFLSRDYQFDRFTVVMPIAAAGEFLALRDPRTGVNRSSGLRVAVREGEDIDAVRDRIKTALADVPFVRVLTWRQEKASLLRAVSIEKTVVGIILGVLILFAGFMIFIVLTVQVVEKTRDLGILQSLGATSTGIASIYFLIGAGVCLVGTLLGGVVGVAFALELNTIQRWIYLLVGFDLFPRTVYYIDRLPVRLDPWDILFIVAPTVLASLLASVVPALRAARKDPVVALRYE